MPKPIGYYTAEIVSFCTALHYDMLPEPVVSEAKQITLDLLGAMIAASVPTYSSTRLLGDLAEAQGGHPECTIVNRPMKTSCLNAALANGTMGYAADIEGGIISPLASQHAGAVLVPTAITVAERQQSTGKDYVTALVIGFEVAGRVGDAARTPYSYPHSFHPSALYGHFGAAALAARLLHADTVELANALGLAGATAGGLINWVTDPTENSRPYVIGIAAQNGVRSALLAKMGYGGPPFILDPTKYNIYDAYSGEMHLDRLVEGLGDRFWIMDNLGTKAFAGCLDIHSGLDALLQLLLENRLQSEDISAIELRVKKDRAPVIDNNELKSHNAQYMMAVAAVNGQITPTDILLDRRDDPKVREMYGRITLIGDPALDDYAADRPAVVQVTTTDGRRLIKSVEWPKGALQNPLTATEWEAKYLSLAAPVMGHERAAQLSQLVNNLEDLTDTAELTELLRPPFD